MNPAIPSDASAVAGLVEEMDRFYGSTEFDSLEERTSQISGMLFGDTPVAHALLCRDGSEPVGLASYSFLWPAKGLTCSLFLKELYVHQTHRGQGIGRLLMRAIGQIALEKRCSRVEWMTDVDNRDAQEFYATLDAFPHAGKVFYRLEDKDIEQLAGDASPKGSR